MGHVKESMSAIRNDENLWSKIKSKLLKEQDGQWSARLAQHAVKLYKEAGGTYNDSIPRSKTSLHKWSQEDWGYAGKPGASRYLPKRVRNVLTPAERKRENQAKGTRKGQRVPYSKSVRDKMVREGIF